MSLKKFKKIAQMLFTLANQLSESAYQNLQKTKFIEERQRLEKQMITSETQYRALVESASDFIWEIDSSGVYTYVSPKIRDMLGFEPYEIIGKSPFDLIDESDINRVELQYQQAVENKDAIVALEKANRHKNGHIVILETSGVPIIDADGTFKGYRGIDRDITKRKTTENKLIASEEKLRMTSDATPFPIAVVDLADDVIQYWSQSAFELFGHTAPTASQWYEIAYPDPVYRQEVVEKWKPFIEIAQKSGKPVNTGEYRIACKDGSERICELYVTFIPQNLIVTFNDFTEQKNIEKELDEYRKHLENVVKRRTLALEAKNKELETFTYSVSHDLKAPLRGIDGYSRLLMEEYSNKLDEEGLFFLNNVRQGTDQMNKLIEDLLAYSRMERKELHYTSIDLKALIENLVKQRRHDIEQCHINLRVKVPFVTIETDTETLRQVLTNYLDNAIKYSKKETSSTVTIGGSQNDKYWTLWVKDDGIGFDPKYLDRIFDIFQRLQRVEDYPGTGVGLAIVRKAVERIDGKVRANSAPGKGSTFYVDIPK